MLLVGCSYVLESLLVVGLEQITLHTGQVRRKRAWDGWKRSPVSASMRSTFCTRKRYALYLRQNRVWTKHFRTLLHEGMEK